MVQIPSGWLSQLVQSPMSAVPSLFKSAHVTWVVNSSRVKRHVPIIPAAQEPVCAFPHGLVFWAYTSPQISPPVGSPFQYGPAGLKLSQVAPSTEPTGCRKSRKQLLPLVSLSADPPAVLTQIPMSNRCGPDWSVAISVTENGVGSVGSQLAGPETRATFVILTSFAVQLGLFNPVACLRHALPLDCAKAGVAPAVSARPTSPSTLARHARGPRHEAPFPREGRTRWHDVPDTTRDDFAAFIVASCDG